MLQCARHLVVFGGGGWNGLDSSRDARWASSSASSPTAARFGATFCSDTPLPNWTSPGITYITNSGQEVRCPVYTDRMGAGDCVNNATYAEAVVAAAARGGRLCTASELISGCGRTRGCQLDTVRGWSSTPDPHCDPTQPCLGVATPSPTGRPTLPPIPAAPPTACDAFEVVDGIRTLVGSVAGPAGATTRHELTCCASEAVPGWTQCGGTPTTLGQVWGARFGPRFVDAKARLGYPAGNVLGEGNSSADGGAFVWALNGCVHNVEWARAAQICNAIVVNNVTGTRARLCTAEELMSHGSTPEQRGCGAASGCGHDTDVIWSSTPAANTTRGCSVLSIASNMVAPLTRAPSPQPSSAPPTYAPSLAISPVQVQTSEAPTSPPTVGAPSVAGAAQGSDEGGGGSLTRACALDPHPPPQPSCPHAALPTNGTRGLQGCRRRSTLLRGSARGSSSWWVSGAGATRVGSISNGEFVCPPSTFCLLDATPLIAPNLDFSLIPTLPKR